MLKQPLLPVVYADIGLATVKTFVAQRRHIFAAHMQLKKDLPVFIYPNPTPMKIRATLANLLLFTCILAHTTQAQETKDSLTKFNSGNIRVPDTLPSTGDISIVPSAEPREEKRKTYFSVGTGYITDNVYQGRKDSATIPYLTPKLGFYHKSGLFAEASAGFVTAYGSESGADMISLDAGYNFTKGHYDGTFTASKFYYNSQSTSVKSAVTGSVEYLAAYDLNFIKPSLLLGLNFGNKTDIVGAFGLEHSFYLIEDKMDLSPAITVNASTQNYYNSYYKIRKYASRKKNKAPAPAEATITGEVLGAANFKILDYEMSVPLNYETGKWSFSIVPVYAVPVHPAEVIVTTTLPNGQSSSKDSFEKIQPHFYCSFEIAIKL